MKKTVSVLLAILLFSTCFMLDFGYTVSASGYATPDMLDGTDNLFLSYTFYSDYPPRGQRTKEGYLPLVGYYNTNGELKDIFFDSFLFLPCVTTAPSGGCIYKNNRNPSNFSDWQLFIDDVFLDGYNISALNEAVGEVKAQLGGEFADFKANIFLTVLYPVITQTNFGDVDGDGITENFENLSDRKKAVKWIIDEQIARLDSGKYENLNLVGFYWFEENFSYDDQEDELIHYMNDYVHSLDYKSIWIPYYRAIGYNKWKDYGFDVACYQPNYMFTPDMISTRVINACETADYLGMGVEIEVSGNVFFSEEYYNRYMEYLKICTQCGASRGVKMYYNDAVNGVFYDAYISKNPDIRRIYDLTYKYASQTLDPDEIELIQEKNRYEGYNIVSLGHSYTTTTPMERDDVAYGYVSGDELTDGKFSESRFGTEWIAFHKSNIEKDGYYYIDLDFGELYYDLSLFSIEAGENYESGIALPKSVEYFISEDGNNYQSIGFAQFKDTYFSNKLAELKLDKPINARYVRVKIEPGMLNFVFVSEFSAGVSSDVKAPPLTIKSSSNLVIDDSNKMYKLLMEENTSSDLLGLFNQNVLICNTKGKECLGNDIIGTGFTVSYYFNGSLSEKYSFCVPGDTNGDGIVGSVDYLIVKRNFLGTYTFDKTHKAAADTNNDGKIDAADYLRIKRHFLGTYDIYKQ